MEHSYNNTKLKNYKNEILKLPSEINKLVYLPLVF